MKLSELIAELGVPPKGQLLDGVWTAVDKMPTKGGAFARPTAVFKQACMHDPAATLETVEAGSLPAEAARYHIFLGKVCPWAHRVLMMRALLGLEDVIAVSLTNKHKEGWYFEGGTSCSPFDRQEGPFSLHQAYTATDAAITTRVTVPTMWDMQQERVICNESATILKLFNSAFQGLAKFPCDYYPAHQREAIDAVSADIYANLNNGVYRAGFGATDEAHDRAVRDVFACMVRLEARLAHSRFLMGERLTLADVQLFPTLVRFDLAYYHAFGCNAKRLADFPCLSAYTADVYQQPRVAATVDLSWYYRYFLVASMTGNRYFPTDAELPPTAPVLAALTAPCPQRKRLGDMARAML